MPARIQHALRRSAPAPLAAIAVLASASAAAGAPAHTGAPEPVVRIAAPRVVAGTAVDVVVTARPLARVRRIEVRVGRRVVARTSGGRVRVRLSARRLAQGPRRIVAVVHTRDGHRIVASRPVILRSVRPRRALRTAPAPAPLNEAPPPAGDPGAPLPPEPDYGQIPFVPPPGTITFRGDFETGSLSQWSNVQAVAGDRIRVVGSPVAQGSRAARFEVRRGDRWRGASGNRAELVSQTGEREGDERWYAWSTMFDGSFPSVGGGFQIFTQWHATVGGSQPTLIFYASGDQIGFKTVQSGSDLRSRPSVVRWTGPMARGSWHHFRLHVKWSANPSNGWVELWHDGVKVVDRAPAAGIIPGYGLYLKQGLYRSDSITPTGVVYHDGMTMTKAG